MSISLRVQPVFCYLNYFFFLQERNTQSYSQFLFFHKRKKRNINSENFCNVFVHVCIYYSRKYFLSRYIRIYLHSRTQFEQQLLFEYYLPYVWKKRKRKRNVWNKKIRAKKKDERIKKKNVFLFFLFSFVCMRNVCIFIIFNVRKDRAVVKETRFTWPSLLLAEKPAVIIIFWSFRALARALN